MYRVWYWLGGYLCLENFGPIDRAAIRFLISYHNEPSYHPWLEYIKEPKVR